MTPNPKTYSSPNFYYKTKNSVLSLCNIIVSVPFIYMGNFPPYVNCIYTHSGSTFRQVTFHLVLIIFILAECPGSFATYETETNIKHTLQIVDLFLQTYISSVPKKQLVVFLVLECLIQKMVLLIYTGLTKEVINSIDTNSVFYRY